MSFTLIRYKDGKEIPIKVSILDAFHSTSSRKPKIIQPKMKVKFWSLLKACAEDHFTFYWRLLLDGDKDRTSSLLCLAVTSLYQLVQVLITDQLRASKPEISYSPVMGAPSLKSTSDNNTNKDIKDPKNNPDHAEESYSAQDDVKIIAMKAIPGTSWNEIKEAIGKQSLSQLKEHYKLHLGPNAEAEQKKAAERALKAEKSKVEGLAKQAEEGEKKTVGEEGSFGAAGGGGGKKKKNKGPGADDAEAGKSKGKGKGKENANAIEVSTLPLNFDCYHCHLKC